jgi:hypothetical protein
MAWIAMVGTFLAGAVVAFAAVCGFHFGYGTEIFEFFSKNMRSSFFSGFLTIGGFMLSLKTFVLVKMKEGLYGSEHYVSRVEQARKLGGEDSLYAPLKRLSDLLFLSILAALTTAGMQLSVGLIPRWWSAGLCLAWAAGTIALLLFSLFQIKSNLDAWFASLDQDYRKKVGDRRAS